jgi:putative flippase GtrA
LTEIFEEKGVTGVNYKIVEHVSRREAIKYMETSDILIMNYPDAEHYARYMSPLKMFEYMASGNAIITTDLPSIREILDDASAFFVKPNNSKDLTRGLLKLLNDDNLRKILGENAREAVAKYSWDERAKNILESIIIGKNNKIIKFLVGGVAVTLLQVVLLYVFSSLLNVWYLLAAQLSFVISFLASFFIYRNWVFPGGSKASHHQFVLYTILTVVNFFMNGFGMFLFVDWLGVWYIYSQIIVKAIICVVNYFLYDMLIFNK